MTTLWERRTFLAGEDLWPALHRQERPKPPGFPRHLEPRVNHDALHALIRSQGQAMAAADLAAWQLAPKVAEEANGRLVLTALHDPLGQPLLEYRRDPDGRISGSTRGAGPDLHRSLQQPAGRGDRPTRPPNARAKARLRDALRLPGPQPPGPKEPLRQLLLPCSTLVNLLVSTLARRLLEEACAVASDYLPNWAVRDALAADEPSRTREYYNPTGGLMNLARNAARRAVMDAVTSLARRTMLRQHQALTDKRSGRVITSSLINLPHRGDTLSVGVAGTGSKLDQHHTLPPQRPTDADPVAAAAHANFEMANTLLEPRATALLAELADPPEHSRQAVLRRSAPERYNELQWSVEAYAGLAATARGLAQVYLSHTSRGRSGVRTPGEIVTRMRRWGRMTPAQWRIFHRLANSASNRIRDPESMRETARLAADANVPTTPLRTLLNLHRAMWRLNPPKRASRNRTERTRRNHAAWVRTANAYLRRSPVDPDGRQLVWVGDALRVTLAAGRPWGPGDWRTLLTRAHRVHADEMARMGRQGHPWPTALGAHQNGEYRLTPLTSPQALWEAWRYMDEATPRPAQTGLPGQYENRRYFLATAPGRSPAIMCLSAATRTWRADGVVTTGNKPTHALFDLLLELAARYAQAEPNPRRTAWFGQPRDPGRRPPLHHGGHPVHRPPSFLEIVGAEVMEAEPDA